MFTLLAKVTVCEVQVSGNETSSSNACYMRKGKTPMSDPGEEQLMESELQSLKLPDNLGSDIAHNIIDISDTVTQGYKIIFHKLCALFNMLCIFLFSSKLFNVKHGNYIKTVLLF